MDVPLMQLIRPYADLSNEDLLALLTDKSIVETDHTSYTVLYLTRLFGKDALAPILGVLSAAMNPYYIKLCSTGLDFSDPETVSSIDALVAGKVIDDAQAAALKWIGTHRYSILDKQGITAELEDIVQARTDIAEVDAVAAQKSLLRETLYSNYDKANQQIEGGDITEWAQVKKLFEGS